MTAVEWLEQILKQSCGKEFTEGYKELFDKAKEMEKQQIIDAYDKGQENPQIEVTNYFEPNTQFYETPF